MTTSGLGYDVRMPPMQKCSTPSQFWAKSRNALSPQGGIPPGRTMDLAENTTVGRRGVTREEKTT